jgi:hypothetical protein
VGSVRAVSLRQWPATLRAFARDADGPFVSIVLSLAVVSPAVAAKLALPVCPACSGREAGPAVVSLLQWPRSWPCRSVLLAVAAKLALLLCLSCSGREAGPAVVSLLQWPRSWPCRSFSGSGGEARPAGASCGGSAWEAESGAVRCKAAVGTDSGTIGAHRQRRRLRPQTSLPRRRLLLCLRGGVPIPCQTRARGAPAG